MSFDKGSNIYKKMLESKKRGGIDKRSKRKASEEDIDFSSEKNINYFKTKVKFFRLIYYVLLII